MGAENSLPPFCCQWRFLSNLLRPNDQFYTYNLPDTITTCFVKTFHIQKFKVQNRTQNFKFGTSPRRSMKFKKIKSRWPLRCFIVLCQGYRKVFYHFLSFQWFFLLPFINCVAIINGQVLDYKVAPNDQANGGLLVAFCCQ